MIDLFLPVKDRGIKMLSGRCTDATETILEEDRSLGSSGITPDIVTVSIFVHIR